MGKTDDDMVKDFDKALDRRLDIEHRKAAALELIAERLSGIDEGLRQLGIVLLFGKGARDPDLVKKAFGIEDDKDESDRGH